MQSTSETRSASSTGARLDAGAWLLLCLLTLASFGTHAIDLGSLGTVVALGIAIVKAGIVLYAFMHLARESVSVRFLVLICALWVALLCAGIALDVAFEP